MLYQLRERLVTLGEDFIIQDEQGSERYVATSKLFSLGEKLSLCDLNGQEIIRIEQQLMTLRPTYGVWHAGREVAVITKLMGFLSEHFVVEVDGSGSLDVQGTPLNHEYSITRADQVVANVSKQWFRMSDRYGVEVQPNENDALMLAIAIVIDLVNHKQYWKPMSKDDTNSTDFAGKPDRANCGAPYP